MAEDYARDGRGRFVKLVCVNAHDRCFMGGPCPYCEPRETIALLTGAGQEVGL